MKTVEEDVVVYGCGEMAQQEDMIEWNLDAINVTKDIPVHSGEKVKVAILDSGIDYSEDIDVKERINFIPGQDNISILYEDSTGHGTCIAGIMAAKNNDIGITGVNSNIELYSARVLDNDNSSKVSRIIDAINWAIEKKVNILSLSFGTTTNSEVLHNAIKKAQENNILIIAAGNGTQIEYPTAYPEVVAVGSIGTDGIISENSAHGEELELVAPGEQILSTGAFDGVMTCDGTSMAVPHVVGVASLLWEKDIAADAELIRMVLNEGAKTYDNKEIYGYGLVDYEYANNIYDICKTMYESQRNASNNLEELQQNGILQENKGIINPKTYKDVDYVKGCWKLDQHQELAGSTKVNLSSEQLSIIKDGAIANDTYIKKMTIHPQWHGFWKDPNKKEKVNYIATYLYISKVAQQVKEGKSSSIERLSGMTKSDYDAMKGIITSKGVNGVAWEKLLKNVNNQNKGLFLCGMALHCATDAFSHSANRIDQDGGTAIRHQDKEYGNKKDAHNPDVGPGRYECSKEIANKVIVNYNNSLPGYASDFVLGSYKRFKMTNISEYVQAVDSFCYYTHQSYFDGLNRSRSVGDANTDDTDD